MNYYLVTRIWGERNNTEREYWRFDTREQASDAEGRLGGMSNDHDPERILGVDGVIPGAHEGTDLYALESELFGN